jgi:hypothetical protein
MTAKKTAGRIALALSLMSAGAAFAAGADGPQWQPFSEIMAMKMMDKDHDGMVSKKEYVDMMSMAWEMNAKKMGVKDDKMTPEQFNQFQQYLKAGAGG